MYVINLKFQTYLCAISLVKYLGFKMLNNAFSWSPTPFESGGLRSTLKDGVSGVVGGEEREVALNSFTGVLNRSFSMLATNALPVVCVFIKYHMQYSLLCKLVFKHPL